MKKFYSLLLAFAATALCASASNFVMNPKGNLMKLNNANSIIRQAIEAPVAKTMHMAAAAEATDAPADLEGMQFIMSYSLPDYDKDGNITALTPMSSIVTMTDPFPDAENGCTYYTLIGFCEGVFNETVTVHPLDIAYFASDGQLQILPGSDLLSVGSTNYTCWTALENNMLSPGMPLIFAWQDGKFEWIPEYSTSQGVVSTTGIAAGIQTENGVSLAAEFLDPSLDICHGIMTTKVYGWNSNTNQQAIFNSEDGINASTNGTTLSLSNWFGIGTDAAIEFAIDKAKQTLTTDATAKHIISGYETNLAPAINTLGSTTVKGSVKKGAGNLAATYTVANGKTTITVPDWNFFVGSSNMYYPLTETTIELNLNIEDGDSNGISDITVDNENAPVEYFNLQGMRINEPAAGQIVIRRQGTKTSKILVK